MSSVVVSFEFHQCIIRKHATLGDRMAAKITYNTIHLQSFSPFAADIKVSHWNCCARSYLSIAFFTSFFLVAFFLALCKRVRHYYNNENIYNVKVFLPKNATTSSYCCTVGNLNTQRPFLLVYFSHFHPL